MEELLALHRKQLRDFTALCTQKKKIATKKTRRGVNDECERLEHELREKQRKEVVELEGTSANGHNREDGSDDDDTEEEQRPGNHEGSSETGLKALSIGTSPPSEPPDTPTQSKKPNRQKARLARRQAELDALAATAATEASFQPDLNALESSKLSTLFEQNSLMEIDIAPDGHCLYSAFASSLTPSLTYRDTRTAAAEYIVSHPKDFSPFLEQGETIEGHAYKVGKTAEWGGEIELLALSKRYEVAVKVLQAQGLGVTTLNTEDEGKGVVWLAYRRKGYGLGEHYNALKKV